MWGGVQFYQEISKESSINMKKIKKYKNDLLMILLFSTIYIIIALILTHGDFLFASTTDFATQHYIFPEYFRTLFYDTKDLLPDFAPNIGGGQNIYNFSYYGLLNPIILISYLLPKIPMIYYLIGASFIIVVSSAFLFYKFLKSHNFKNSTCIITSLLFIFATPILFHAKRHIMFISYFPFLIGSLFGVDRFIKKKKTDLLIICTTLMIFTSFYYSVSGILVLIIYGIYSYIKENNKKEILKFLMKFSIPFIISILISAILLLPTAYTLIEGRGEAITHLEKWMLLIPNFKFLFNAYGPGLSLLEFILITMLIINKDIKKETRILALILVIIFLFPIFNYILNGTLYINSKSLIPFLPLALLLIAISLEKILKNEKLLKIYLIISTCLITIIVNFNDTLILKNNVEEKKEQDYQSLINEITTKDKSFYRIGNETYMPYSINKVYNMKEYKSSVYSSTQNSNYQNWLQKTQKNNQPYRNNMILSPAGNTLSEAMMGEKYIISTKMLKDGYNLVSKKGKFYLYENTFALPIIYASKNNLTKKDINKLDYPENIIAEYTKTLPKNNMLEKAEFEIKNKKNLTITKQGKIIKIKAEKNAKMTVVPKVSLEDKILFITFKNKFNRGCYHDKNDQTITINNISNKLTCRDWKYHNKNYTFHYILISPKQLDITYEEAYYKLDDIKIYTIPKSVLINRKEEITPVKIEHNNTKGDKVVGTIEVSKEKSNVEVAIPYDKGFTIKVDNKKIKYQESIQNGIAFKVSKGKHKIEITYKSPLKDIASIISVIGIILWIGVIIQERKRT